MIVPYHQLIAPQPHDSVGPLRKPDLYTSTDRSINRASWHTFCEHNAAAIHKPTTTPQRLSDACTAHPCKAHVVSLADPVAKAHLWRAVLTLGLRQTSFLRLPYHRFGSQ
jgi:hypothetical protein